LTPPARVSARVRVGARVRISARMRGGLLAAVVAACVVFGALQFAPLPDRLAAPLYSRALFAQDGTLLDVQIAADQQWRLPPPRSRLPARYEAALIAFEDRWFRQHPGINPVSIVRAAVANAHAGRVVRGGSTITMQIARLAYANPPRTFGNKLAETGLALTLEWRFDKDELLRLYATHAPFGGNVVGLHAASWRWFGRPPTELSWAEAALLAVLPNSPGLLHPGRNRTLLLAKRDRLLARLHQNGTLAERDYALALREPLPEAALPWPAAAPHLLARMIAEHPREALYNTTLDARLQHRFARLLAQHGAQLEKEGVRNLAAVVIDHRTMHTAAYIGNSAANVTSGSFVDIAASPRSTGSILKPLLYGLMLQEGELLPDTLVPDIPSNFRGYAPQNFDQQYRGAVPAREALVQSLNVPAVRMLRAYGVARFRERLQAFGLAHVTRSAEDYGLSLILGGAEASLWELVQAYANVVHVAATPDARPQRQQAALLVPSVGANSIRDARRLEDFPLRRGAAWLVLSAMVDVVRPDADMFWRDYENSQVIAWKTGTSYGLRDGWAIGSNGQYTVGIWTGNADGSAAATLGGARSAGPVLMQSFALVGNSAWIRRPVTALRNVRVCADDGFLAADGCAATDATAPADSHFARATPYHQRVFLSADGRSRVHAGCEQPLAMRVQDWFVLPPAQEYFWRLKHADYRRLPPWRADCIATLARYAAEQPFELLYPGADSEIYIPLELNGKQGSAVFRAVHRDARATLHWHLDADYLGATTLFHERTIRAPPGPHTLTLVDQNGARLQRRFDVMDPAE
jgi:penicillin-binding protein 1C